MLFLAGQWHSNSIGNIVFVPSCVNLKLTANIVFIYCSLQVDKHEYDESCKSIIDAICKQTDSSQLECHA